MKYVNQLEHRYLRYSSNTSHPEKDHMTHGTFARSGCGLASLIMVADWLLPNSQFDLRDAVQLSYDTNANRNAGTDMRYIAPVFAYKFGLELEFSDDIADVIRCVQTGGAVVALSRGDREGYTGVFTHGGHYMAVIGMDRQGRLMILDPSWKEGKFDEAGREGKVEVKDKICYCAPEVLDEDCKHRPDFYLDKTASYCLFWRK